MILQLEDLDSRIANAWLTAARDLGISVEIKTWLCPAGVEHSYVFLRDFGGREGTCAFSMDCYQGPHQHLLADFSLERLGCSCNRSVLTDSYATYDRDVFSATLDDWQWFGEGPPPTWYTGKTWSA